MNLSLSKNTHPRIVDTITRLICSDHQYWGEFSLFVNFQEETTIHTFGVNVVNCSLMYYYNKKFLDKLDDKELMFIHIHEILHLICDHCQRTKTRHKKLSNIAQDMIINDCIKQLPNMSRFLRVPDIKNINLCFVPNEYQGERIFEDLYEWLSDEYEKWKKRNPIKKNKEEKEIPKDPTLDDIFENLEDYEFDFHFDEMIDGEMRKQIIEDILNNLQARGFETNDVEKILNRLSKSKKNYIKDIVRAISCIKGNLKIKSFKRPNRRNIVELKGKIKHGSALNVVLDTSGSMNGYFEKILSVIFRDNIDINLIQCDTEVKCVESIKNKKQLQNTIIKGLGGTVIQPGIDYVVENLNKVNTLILTDGGTDHLDVTLLKKCLIISTDVLPKVKGNFKGVILID